VRVDIWSFVRTHDTHENPQTESVSLSSPRVQCNYISTSSESHNRLSRPGNINVCVLGFEDMWSNPFLLELLAVLHLTGTPMLFPTVWSRHLAPRRCIQKKQGVRGCSSNWLVFCYLNIVKTWSQDTGPNVIWNSCLREWFRRDLMSEEILQ
jgi:hypothetical protein